jgi:phosphatidylglycerol lysyltransferase
MARTTDPRPATTGRTWLRYAAPVAGVVLLGFALWILHRELRDYQYRDLVRALHGLPSARILIALVLAALNYAVLTGYDVLGLRYAGHRLPYPRVALASFVGYAVSNSLGFGLLTAAPLRYRLYSRWGVPALDIAKVVAFYSATLWLGLLAVGGLSFLVTPLATPAFLHVPVATLRPVGVALLLLLGAYLGLSLLHRREFRVRSVRLSVPAPRLALAQVAFSSLDWMLAAGILYALLPPGTLSYPEFLGVYVLAQLAGLVSHVPGGVGVFDSVILVFLRPSLPAPEVLGILLVFRGLYYLLPLVSATLLLVAYEGRHLRRRLPAVEPMAAWFSSLVPYVMAGLVFLGGVILQASGATPAAGARLAWLDRLLPLAVIEVSHLLGSAIGVALLLLARGLQLRLAVAFHVTATLLVAGIACSLLKGLDWEEATALALVLAGLWTCRREFYRPAALLDERFTPGWIAAVVAVLAATIWLGSFSLEHVAYSHELWWRFALDAQAPRFLRATVASAVVLGAAGLARLLRPAQAKALGASPR